MSNKLNTELKVQIALLRWAKREFPVQSEMLLSIPNGVASNRIRGNLLNMSGLAKGIPDMFLACPVQIEIDKPDFYHGLWIELKKDRTCYPTVEQKETLRKLALRGYVGVVAKGLEEGQFWIRTYLMRAEKINDETYTLTFPRPNPTCYHPGNTRLGADPQRELAENTAEQHHLRAQG